MAKEKITKAELKIIREGLPEGAVEEIATATGFAVSTIKQILIQPRRYKKEVIDMALTLVEKEMAFIESQKKRIKDIS